MSNNKNSKKDNNNLELLLTIAREEYNNYFQRIQTLDIRIGFLMAFYGIIFSSMLNMNNFKNGFNILTIQNLVLLKLNIINITVFLINIILLIYNLISKDTSFVPTSLFKEEIKDEDKLIANLLEKTYKKSIVQNNSSLDKKHNMYNISCILLMINIILTILINISKII